MAKYRKKQIIIDAIQFNGDNYNEIVSFTKGNATIYTLPNNSGELPHKKMYITTMHQGQKVEIVSGDWIIPEIDGIHFYPCKNDVFIKTYELADQ